MRSELTICCQDQICRLDVSEFSLCDSVYWKIMFRFLVRLDNIDNSSVSSILVITYMQYAHAQTMLHDNGLCMHNYAVQLAN